MLLRVALHQTRLNLPGLTLDARGVVIGTHALVVTPSLDRLVALLASLSDDGLLARTAAGMAALELAPTEGARAWALRCACDAVDLADRLRRVAGLVMGHAFVGAGRHYVEHRDGSAPYGFDAPATDDPGDGIALYHRGYRRSYSVLREVSPARLALALSARSAPPGEPRGGARWILAEPGPGRALIGYLARRDVDARVGEVIREASVSGEATRCLLFVAPSWPTRLGALARTTPGLTSFVPVGASVAVEEGFTHPIALDALPELAGPALTLFRGRGAPAVRVEDGLPTVSVASLVRPAMSGAPARLGSSPGSLGAATLEVRLVPSARASRGGGASWVPASELELLRRLLYLLGRRALSEARLALTAEGALVLSGAAASLPIGAPLRAIGDRIFAPAGFDVSPAISATALAEALQLGAGDVALLRPEGAALFAPDAFVSAEAALVAGPRWAPLRAMSLDLAQIELTAPRLVNEDVGGHPLRDLT